MNPRRRLLWCALALQLAFGAIVAATGSQAAVSEGIEVPLVVGGVARSYRLYVPPTLAAARPSGVVLAMHGLRGSAAGFQRQTGLDRIARQKGFVVAYPQGLDNSWNAGTCCGTSVGRNVDDVGFLAAVIADIRLKTSVDQVFATGFSNGAMMAQRLACERPELISAVAAVQGTLVASCAAPRPMSTLHINGRLDTIVPYGGLGFSRSLGSSLPSVPATVGTWERLNGCSGLPSVDRSATITRRSYSSCAGRSSVHSVALSDAGHAWPTTYGNDFDASAEIWAYFRTVSPQPASYLRPTPVLSTRITARRQQHGSRTLVAGEVLGRYDAVIEARVILEVARGGAWQRVGETRTDFEGRFKTALSDVGRAAVRARYAGPGEPSALVVG